MAQYSVGSVEGVPFTACTFGKDLLILGADFTRVQTLTVPSVITSIDCSTNVGRIAASFEDKLIIFDPTRIENNWVQTAVIHSPEPISVISFNLEGTRIITGGRSLQLWIDTAANGWQNVWSCQTATSISYLKYSPDGTLFYSAGKSDRLVKIWNEINFKFSFVYAVHPLPVTSLDWRRTSKYCPKGSVANVLLTSCKDNISRIWIQPNQTGLFSRMSLHLGGTFEAKSECESVNWVNNKEIFINRSIEILLHDMLIRILKGNALQTSSTNSPLSAGKSCSGSENDTDDPVDANDDTITAESSKKLRHKLCRKMNKQRALAASGRQDLLNNHIEDNSNQSNRTSLHSNNGNSSPTSLVKEFDRTLDMMLKKWQGSNDLIMVVNKKDGSLTILQVKYLDGEDVGVYRQIQMERLSRIELALPYYDATTMSLNIIAYSPSAYLEVKRAYLAVTGATSSNSNQRDFSPSDVLEILSMNNDTGKSETTSMSQTEDSVTSIIESEPSIFIVTQHLSGILGLWRLNFDLFPNLQNIESVSRITGLPIDPSWLCDGVLTVEFDETNSMISTNWQSGDFTPEQESHVEGDKDYYKASELAKSVIGILPQYHTKQLVELLAFGKLQKVKTILNDLVNYLADETEPTSANFNPSRAKLLTEALTHTQLPGLSNIDQMHLLAVADAVAMFDASPEDLHDQDDPEMISTNIAIDSLDDRSLKFLIAMRQHNYLTRCLPKNQRDELRSNGIGSQNFIWAFHSETQDELISLIPCVQRGKLEWSELREFGIGWWVKKLEVIKSLIEKVIQSAYRVRQEPLDVALFYLAMKKKTLVCALLRRVSGSDKRLLKLFEQDFSDPVNRKKALKNAYALLGKHRFEHAAAFFILAGSIWDAVEVCINNLNDIQLAIVLIRLHDNDANFPENLKRLLFTEILGSSRPVHKDPFLRSIAYWKLGDYLAATNTLLENDIGDIRASVFNFYLYLKDQPLVKNRVIEAADKEQELCFSTASAYFESGCPLLALEVLSRLDTSKAMRMRFRAGLLVIMDELNTLPPQTGSDSRDEFFEWFKSSLRDLKTNCSYTIGIVEEDEQDNGIAQVSWVEKNESILRTMLTFCSLNSGTNNNLIKVRLELLVLLDKLKNKD